MKLKKDFKNKIEARHIYAVVMTIVYVYLIARCIYQYVTGSGLDGCKIELLLILISSIIVYIFSFFELDIFNKKHAKKKKGKSLNCWKKNCVFESSFLSLIITTFVYLLIAYDVIYIDFYNMIPNQEVLSIIGFAVILFFVFFLIIYLIMFRFFKNRFAKLK